MAKKGLGRGLGVIFGSETEAAASRRRAAGESKHATKKQASTDAGDVSRETPEGASIDGARSSQKDVSHETSGHTSEVSPTDRARLSQKNVSRETPEDASTDEARSPQKSVSRETPEIEIDLIEPNASQPRKRFDEESLSELADSIAQHGVLQPILVRKKAKGYEIIIGERRWRAAKIAGLSTIPAVIKEMDSQASAEAALIENIQREDLGAVEEARAYRALIDEYFMTQEELAKKVSKSRTAIANSLRLLKLDPEILSLIDEGALTAGHARAVLSIPGRAKQQKAAREIAAKGMSVRDAERLAKRYSARAEDAAPSKPKDDELERYIHAAEQDLRSALGTKVSIKQSGARKGKIEIEYYSQDELNGIIEKITGSD